MVRWLVSVMLLAGPIAVPPALAQSSAPAVAGDATEVAALSRLLLIPQAMEVMREEGIANGREIGGEEQLGAGASLWQRALERIYEPARMTRLFDQAFEQALLGQEPTVAAASAFLAGDAAQRAVQLEISARRALLDKDVEAAANLAYDNLSKENPDRQALIERFVTANDLIESNIMGAMNANLAFLRGMSSAGGEGLAMTEADMLAQVWAGEAETRSEMIDWLYPFLTMAYQPLSDAELESYISFSETPEGKRLNAAMFAAYDAMLTKISGELGVAFGQSLQGDDI